MSTATGYKAMEVEEEGEEAFTERLYSFMASRGTPIVRIPIFDHRDLNLYRLYKEVTSRGGVETVIMNKMWRSVTSELSVDPDRTDAGYRLRTHYLKYLYPYERRFFLGLSDDDFDFVAFERMLTKASNSKDKGAKNGADYDDMNSESYDSQDNMNHYTYSTEAKSAEHSSFPPNFSPTNLHTPITSPSRTSPTPSHVNNNTTATRGKGANGSESNGRMGTRSRTGAKPSSSQNGSPEGSNEGKVEWVEQKETTKKGRGKRARTEKQEKEPERSPVPEGEQMSLANNFAKLDLGALKKYKQYHQMRLDTSANKSEIIEAVSVHFSQQQVDELAIIKKFVAHVKSESETRREREARRRNSKIVRV